MLLQYSHYSFCAIFVGKHKRIKLLRLSVSPLYFLSDGTFYEYFGDFWKLVHAVFVSQRVTFKILLYVYKALNGQAPLYITELFSCYTPARPLRSSAGLSRLVVPKFRSVAGEGRFAVAAAKAWNCLPGCVGTAQSANVFGESLGTHLF